MWSGGGGSNFRIVPEAFLLYCVLGHPFFIGKITKEGVLVRGARDALSTTHPTQHNFFQVSFLSPIQNQYKIHFKTSHQRDTIKNLLKFSCFNTTSSRFSCVCVFHPPKPISLITVLFALKTCYFII